MSANEKNYGSLSFKENEESRHRQSSLFGKMPFTSEEQKVIDEALRQKLKPSFISQRTGIEGQSFAFVQGWRIISLANQIFGFNGWSNSVINQTVDFLDQNNGRYYLGVSTKVRVELRDGTYHEDIGYGSSEGLKSKAQSLEKAKKDSVTDGLKRSLRHFGSVLGNCLSDKNYVQLVSKLNSSPSTQSDLILQREGRCELLQREGRCGILQREGSCDLVKDMTQNTPNSHNKTKISNISNKEGIAVDVQIPTPPPSIAPDEFGNINNEKPKNLPLRITRNQSTDGEETTTTTNAINNNNTSDNNSNERIDDPPPDKDGSFSTFLSPHPNKGGSFSTFLPPYPVSGSPVSLSLIEMFEDESRHESPPNFGGFNRPGDADARVKGNVFNGERNDDECDVALVEKSPMSDDPKVDPTYPEWSDVISEDDPSFWDQLMSQQQVEAQKELEEQASTHSFAHSIGLVPSKARQNRFISSFSLPLTSRAFDLDNPFCPPSLNSCYESTDVSYTKTNSRYSLGSLSPYNGRDSSPISESGVTLNHHRVTKSINNRNLSIKKVKSKIDFDGSDSGETSPTVKTRSKSMSSLVGRKSARSRLLRSLNKNDKKKKDSLRRLVKNKIKNDKHKKILKR